MKITVLWFLPSVATMLFAVIASATTATVAGDETAHPSNRVEKVKVLQGSKEISAKPTPAEKRRLESDITQQYNQLRTTLETEDSYSPKLGEDYYSYGKLLRAAGRYDEAIEAFTDALHIEKVNNGIYAIEQIPSLMALFEMHYALKNTEDFEDYIERILWIESKNPPTKDELSFDILVKAGNHYIDQYLLRPVPGQAGFDTLLRARHHLLSALKQYSDAPIEELLMPYGELALVSFLEGRMQPDVDRTVILDDPRLKRSRHLEGRQVALASYFENAFPRGEGYLRSYYKKAKAENNTRHEVLALISLGDFNQLFKRNRMAWHYYFQAWQATQRLGEDDILVGSFSSPVSLPHFHYSAEREPIVRSRPSVLVPLSLAVDQNGRVRHVTELPDEHKYAKYFAKARRSARRLIFRPKLVEGRPVYAEQVDHTVRIYQKR